MTGESRVIRVAIVDDVEWVRTMLSDLLDAQDGVEVAGTAADGIEGVELVLQARPDITLMDLKMPKMDGIAATQEILSRWPTARIVMNSAYGDETLIESARMAGAVGYVTKDQRPAALIAALLTHGRSPI